MYWCRSRQDGPSRGMLSRTLWSLAPPLLTDSAMRECMLLQCAVTAWACALQVLGSAGHSLTLALIREPVCVSC